MSAWEGFILALVTLGSVCAAYWSGQQTILNRFRDMEQRRKERERRWREFDDQE
jgi:DNA-binding helix-hairpin-helix protein with protein kinase domain